MEARNQNNILQQSALCTHRPSQYDVRAPPRRRAKGDDVDEQPVFLRKAYNMISSCPSEIGELHCHFFFFIAIMNLINIFATGGWSDEGDSIVIKDMKAFSEKVIPTAYRHNNFASFVRQLNFCKRFHTFFVPFHFLLPSVFVLCNLRWFSKSSI